MKLLNIAFTIICFTLITSACKKDINTAEGDIQFHIIQNHSLTGISAVIDETSIVIGDTPLFHYEDIIEYNSSNYTFEFNQQAQAAFANQIDSLYFKAFALVANGETIYTGYFWPLFSSQTCDWVVVNPNQLQTSNKLTVNLGYPGSTHATQVEDKRNDQRLLDILDRDGKLKN
ncbi:MAG: hypothetical protein JEZ03_14180 [Bacteroidales bacterium]|nr:hypothetical protein [Bacteroidales bacterium]